MNQGRAEVQEAVNDLHRYLSDEKAPLMFAEALEVLLQAPPEQLAAYVNAWVSRVDGAAPTVDLLFHAARKLTLMGEFELVDKALLDQRLDGLTGPLLAYCPEADREGLKHSLNRLREPGVRLNAAVGALHRPGGAAPAPAAAAPDAAAPTRALTAGLKRLGLLFKQLRPAAAGENEERRHEERRHEVASQIVTTAAAESATSEELQERLAPLRDAGIATDTEGVFRTLANSIAGWALPAITVHGGPQASSHQLAAMGKILALGDDAAEIGKRFREMVTAAVDQLNAGQMGRAATMLELAERMVAEQKVKPHFVKPVREHGHERLDAERLKKMAERTDLRASLRTVMNFFDALTPRGLLDALNGEPRRERRHYLLALLEAHEEAARAEAWELLKQSLAEGATPDPFFQMNLVYLLRVIPRPASASLEDEVGAVMQSGGRDSPAPLIKQIVAFLAASRHDKSERALMTYLKVFEGMLLDPATAAYPPNDVAVMLDRTCAALARYGTARAWRLLIQHGLRTEARLGASYSRLAEAGRVDLSASPDVVEKLLEAIHAELPKGGLLGMASRTNEDKIAQLITALGGTPLPQVRTALDDLVESFPDRKFAAVAKKVSAGLATASKAPSGPSPSLSGDLELFGLPNLLQTFSQSQVSGVLALIDPGGQPRATMLIDRGKYLGGQYGHIMGEDVIYQLLERPFPATFAFTSRTDVATHPRAGEPEDVLSLLMEGVRRHDELKMAAAVAGDETLLKPTGQPHTSLGDEDPDYAHYVWTTLGQGRTVAQCEAAISSDSYRVRRLLAHWLEEGALQAA